MGVNSVEDQVNMSEVLKERLYFAPLPRVEDTSGVVQCLPKRATCFCIDSELVYEPFFADFGPLNLACTYRFCWKLHHLLKEADEQGMCVFFSCSADPKKKSNAAVLVCGTLSSLYHSTPLLPYNPLYTVFIHSEVLGAYLVLFCGAETDAAYAPLSTFEPFMPFRDPTCGISTYRLTVFDCIRAILKAHHAGWIDFNNFNLEEYEYFEQVENGDLSWIVPNKLMAFSGPSAKRLEIFGYRTLVPEDYVEYFHRVGITAVVRLNRKAYDRRRFADHGLAHYDLYFPDGSCPPDRILRRFLEIVEETPGALAVHCKAGLGRTGALIGCYIMKHYRFTCNETLGYLRIVRPGSVIGPQQHYLKEMQVRMWKAGDVMRHQQAQANVTSQQYHPPLHESGALPGSAAWNQNANRSLISRKYSSNLSYKRRSILDQEESGLLDQSSDSSPHRRLLDSTLSPQRSRGKTGSSSGNYAYKTPSQMRAFKPEDEGSGSIRTRRHGGVSPTRSSSYVQNFKGMNFNTALGRLSLSDESEPSSSSNTRNYTRASPLQSRAIKTTGRSSFTTNGSGENLGILRNATRPPPPEAQQARGGNVVVQRVINSAGQPRKVVLPVAETASSGRIMPQASMFRDTSPQRCYGTPGQLGNMVPSSSKWGSSGQSTYTNLN